MIMVKYDFTLLNSSFFVSCPVKVGILNDLNWAKMFIYTVALGLQAGFGSVFLAKSRIQNHGYKSNKSNINDINGYVLVSRRYKHQILRTRSFDLDNMQQLMQLNSDVRVIFLGKECLLCCVHAEPWYTYIKW